jgi:hypothetical protein
MKFQAEDGAPLEPRRRPIRIQERTRHAGRPGRSDPACLETQYRVQRLTMLSHAPGFSGLVMGRSGMEPSCVSLPLA